MLEKLNQRGILQDLKNRKEFFKEEVVNRLNIVDVKLRSNKLVSGFRNVKVNFGIYIGVCVFDFSSRI